ncbi:hypothetical protein P12x_003253 [Tundrisphaera lichenicola]
MPRFIADHIGVGPEWLAGQADRDETRKAHLIVWFACRRPRASPAAI